MRLGFKILLLLSLLLLPSQPGAYADDTSDDRQQSLDQKLITSLEALQDTLKIKQDNLKALQQQLGSTELKGREEEARERIKQFARDIQNLESEMLSLATGVELSEKYQEQPLTLSEELRALLVPLVNEAKQLTSKPREIHQLRSQRQDYSKLLRRVERGRIQLESLLQQEISTPLKKLLTESLSDWKQREQVLTTELEVVETRLAALEGGRESVSTIAQNVFELFFRSRGRNLFLALLAAFLFAFFFRRLASSSLIWGHESEESRLSPAGRFMKVSLLLVTAVGAVLVFLLVLFFFGDWVLLTISALVLIGILWASKDLFVRFWNQAVLLLNMGPVREKERLVFNGLPYRVRSLNFYSVLENPALEGGRLRLPLSDLVDLRSRPASRNEPWFPSKVDDFVVLSDETYGKVLHQTPEMVRLGLKGGADKSYPTADFLSLSPMNLSKGFRLNIPFGLDYELQSDITEKIPAQLKNFLEEHMGVTPNQVSYRVEFGNAGASSLDLAVIADFVGDCAVDYDVLRRRIQRVCVDACNQYGWNIPFTQLTLHQQ